MNKFFTWIFLLFSMVQLVQANDSSSMVVNLKDPEFVISLPANPTTGFQWQVLQYNKQFITLNKSYFKKAQSPLIGSGGTMFFRFTLNKGKKFPQNTIIIFKYARPWEANKGTLKKIQVNFK